ncbi:MAG: molybdopterin-dependent oxidoreductase [Desulfobacterales bacterium]|nr:molybdopterin-dependent oxidoreductase [Desulfobacterales bacterium]
MEAQDRKSKKGKWVPTYCFQCNAGPDLARVYCVDGVATKVEGNIDFLDKDPSKARVCVKAYGLIQKLYNPHRIKGPLKRTNPKKGRDEDPGWVEISWDEALDMVAARFRAVREKGLLDEAGYPQLVFAQGADGTPPAFFGTLSCFYRAWGPADHTLRSGGGIRCYHSEHLYGEFWHRSFVCSADSPLCRFVIAFAQNSNASTGVHGVHRQADARVRGLRRVQVEPQLSVTAATADEWIPIRPKTDPAFLFAMLHVLLHEVKTWDVEFLKTMTNSPYLVGPDGNYARDAQTGKPLVWDAADNRAKPFDNKDIGDFALEGDFVVADAAVTPVFALLREHMREFTPEWAAAIAGVSAATIRRLTKEFADNAMIGSSIEVDGVLAPYRPVSIILGRSVNNGPGSYQAVWAQHVLQILVGALEVPGGHLGSFTQIGGAVEPGPDGFMANTLGPTDAANWPWPPKFRDACTSLTPMIGIEPQNRQFGAYHLGYLNMLEPKEKWPQASPPAIYITHKCNPAVAQSDTGKILEVLAQMEFHVAFGYTLDETTHFADVVLPENGDLEGLQLFRVGGVKTREHFWEHVGMALRQPVVDPPFNTRDITDICTELADRIGILKEYNVAINTGGFLGIPLKTAGFDFSLELDRKYGVEEIVDRFCKASTLLLSEGKETHDLNWYKTHGAYMIPNPKFEALTFGRSYWRPWYLHKIMREKGLRWELPYQERLKRIGEQLSERLHSEDIRWWDKQLEEYKPFPEYWDIPGLWTTAPEYDLWLISTRSMQFAWASNVAVPLMIEMAELVLGHSGVMLNADAARKRGIGDGDEIWIESPIGRVKGKAVLREGVHPDVVVMTNMFGHWVTPVAKDLGWPSMNPVTPLSYELTDETGGTSDHVRVKVYKVRPLKNTPFRPISASGSKFNPQNT